MPHSRSDAADNPIELPDRHIKAIDVPAAIRMATEQAFDIMAEDVKAGQLDISRTISIQDEAGKTVHVLHFRDLVHNSDGPSN